MKIVWWLNPEQPTLAIGELVASNYAPTIGAGFDRPQSSRLYPNKSSAAVTLFEAWPDSPMCIFCMMRLLLPTESLLPPYDLEWPVQIAIAFLRS